MYPVFRVLAFVPLLVCSATAQATTLPQCAIGCARADAIKAGCDLSDTPCLCKTSFSLNVIQCNQTTSCSKAEQAQVSAILTAMCAGVSSGRRISFSFRPDAWFTNASASTSIPISVSLSHSSVGIPLSSLSGSAPVTGSSTAPASSSTAPPTSSAAASISNSAPSTSPTAGGAQGIYATPRMGLVGIVAAGLGLRLWIL
ncbi:hypothetical protein B0H13DRAFT_2028498 [Mycena leptocephala]|nr:hypothetical protein B0H13DRAFT_2028498 [Mycena leptocephala]